MTSVPATISNDDSARPLLLPRGLIFLSFLWLVASWGLSIGFRPPLHPNPASYEPGVRMMLIGLLVGLLIGWPLYRLSQPASAYPIRQTLLDLVVMLSMVQVVVWPLRLVTTWTRGRMAAVDLTLILWAVIAGALVAASIGSKRRGVRTLAMAGCVGLAMSGPALAWIGTQLGIDWLRLIDLSPLMSIHALGSGKGAAITTADWQQIGIVGAAASIAWVALLAYAGIGRLRGSQA